MDDTDIIARVYSAGFSNDEASRALKASRHYVPQPKQDPSQVRPYDSRDTTPPTETAPAETAPMSDSLSPSDGGGYVALRYSRAPASSYGFIFGRNPQSDVRLPNIAGLSHFHFSITFDDSRRLIVWDLKSTAGTQVTYDGAGAGIRKNFKWIIGGDSNAHDKGIIVSLSRHIHFRIVVANHHFNSSQHQSRADNYCKGQAQPEVLLKRLAMDDPPDTMPGTGAHTPQKGAIYLGRHLGNGSYGDASRLWNVSTAEQFVVKKPNPKRKLNKTVWRNEIYIMELIAKCNHPHIVQFLRAEREPSFEIYLEYAPGGSLEKYETLSTLQSWMVLQQGLGGLKFLHEHDPPVVHRDIKPANILVHDHGPGFIHIKLADFGLSRDDDNLSTICGTAEYYAPELYINTIYKGSERQSYGPKADIWSLGVVVMEYVARKMPERDRDYRHDGLTWCNKILKLFRLEPLFDRSAIGDFLFQNMLVISPDARQNAAECLDRASRIAPTESRALAPSTTSVTSGIRQTSIGPSRGSSEDTVTPRTAQRKAAPSQPKVAGRLAAIAPSGYAMILVNGHGVYWEPKKRRINITQLLKAYGVPRGDVKAFLDKKNTGIARYAAPRGRGSRHVVRGTFIPCDAVRTVCAEFDLDPAAVFRSLPGGATPSQANGEAGPPPASAVGSKQDVGRAVVGGAGASEGGRPPPAGGDANQSVQRPSYTGASFFNEAFRSDASRWVPPSGSGSSWQGGTA